MEIQIYTDHRGKVHVVVQGNSKNTPEQVAKAYIKVIAELKKGD